MLHYISGFFGRSKGLTYADFDRYDMGYDEDATAFDCEKMLIEEGDVVGITATVANGQIQPTQGKLPTW